MDSSRFELRPKRVLLAISGSIAAYKAAEITSQLTQQGCEVKCLLTESAEQFITPLTLETLSRNPVHRALFGPAISGTDHIRLARWADLMVFAPATANLISKLALGLADDLVTTVALATEAPGLLAPAMNTVMWSKPVIQAHLKILRERGVFILEPQEGLLACGEEGPGKLADPQRVVEKIFELLSEVPGQAQQLHDSAHFGSSLKNHRILITAGPTVSRIDAVRYMTNPSTGRMGAAMAEEALGRGAEVTYVLGVDKGVERPVPPPGSENRFTLIEVETAEEMLAASLGHLSKATGVIATAAVLDYRVQTRSEKKLKRATEPMKLDLIPSVDVLSELREQAKPGQWFLGFAAETDQLESYASDKLERKKLDFLFANRIARTGQRLETGFGSPTNGGILLQKGKEPRDFSVQSKKSLAKELWDILEIYENHPLS